MVAKFLIFLLVAVGGALSSPLFPDSFAANETSCVNVENINDMTTDVKRDFFGKVGINSNTKLVLKGTLKNTTAVISLDDDIHYKDSSMGISIESKIFKVYTKKQGKVTNLRQGTHVLKTGSKITVEVFAVETGPDFNKYAFVVNLNNKLWFFIEEQAGTEILYSNYVTINAMTITSVQLCLL